MRDIPCGARWDGARWDGCEATQILPPQAGDFILQLREHGRLLVQGATQRLDDNSRRIRSGDAHLQVHVVRVKAHSNELAPLVELCKAEELLHAHKHIPHLAGQHPICVVHAHGRKACPDHRPQLAVVQQYRWAHAVEVEEQIDFALDKLNVHTAITQCVERWGERAAASRATAWSADSPAGKHARSMHGKGAGRVEVVVDTTDTVVLVACAGMGWGGVGRGGMGWGA